LIKLGLTGPIAGGKSTVAKLLAERGAEVIDCDELAREVTDTRSVLDAIAKRFGQQVLRADSSLDRAALGAIVFGCAADMADLEALVHPGVRRLRNERLAGSDANVAVIEAIKLIEAGYAQECDKVWVVTAAPEIRLQRLMDGRGMDEAAARQRIEAQTNLPLMLASAHRVIRNDGSAAELEAQVDDAWWQLVGLA